MLKSSKRTPAYEDTDLMPFGKFKGQPLQDVPADYFVWLWGKRPLSDIKLQNYIWNSQDAIAEETGEAFP